MGFVVLAGLFEPGTSVSLYTAPDGVLRANGEGLTGRRLADKDGTVGFDGLQVGERYIASGFDVYGNPLELACRALSAQDGNEVAQPPIRPDLRGPVGTAERRPEPEPVGAPDAILHTGVPAGVPLGAAAAA